MEEVLDDMQLIWDNCKLYNQKGSVIFGVMLVDLCSSGEIGEIV